MRGLFEACDLYSRRILGDRPGGHIADRRHDCFCCRGSISPFVRKPLYFRPTANLAGCARSYPLRADSSKPHRSCEPAKGLHCRVAGELNRFRLRQAASLRFGKKKRESHPHLRLLRPTLTTELSSEPTTMCAAGRAEPFWSSICDTPCDFPLRVIIVSAR